MKITCQSCGKRYDYDETELCPRCGAYNSVDKQETAVQLIQELEESHQRHEQYGQECDGQDEEELRRRKERLQARREELRARQEELRARRERLKERRNWEKSIQEAAAREGAYQEEEPASPASNPPQRKKGKGCLGWLVAVFVLVVGMNLLDDVAGSIAYQWGLEALPPSVSEVDFRMEFLTRQGRVVTPRRWGRLSRQGELWQQLTALEDAFGDPPLSQGELCYVDLDISLRDENDLWTMRPYLEQMDQTGYLTTLKDPELCARLQEAFPGDPEVLSYYSSVWESGSYRFWFLVPEGTGELWLNLPEYKDDGAQMVESVWRLALPEEEAMICE